MILRGVLEAVRQSEEYLGILQRLREADRTGGSPFQTWELLGAARPAVLAALRQDWEGPVLVVCAQPERARGLYEQTAVWDPNPLSQDRQGNAYSAGLPTDGQALSYFPAPDALFYDSNPWDGETIRRRATLLSLLASEANPPSHMVFTSVWALMTVTAPPQRLREATRTLKVGAQVPLGALLQDLVAAAYEPASVVEDPGTFSQRGGIVDVYAVNVDEPLRIEWLGNRIETIRSFDPVTQRSLQQLAEATVFPASEALPGTRGQLEECLPTGDDQLDMLTASRVQRDRERLELGQHFRGIEFYLPCLQKQSATLLDYLPANVLVVLDDLPQIDAAARGLESQAHELRVELLEQRQITNSFPAPFRSWETLCQSLRSRVGLVLGYDVEAGESLITLDEPPSAINSDTAPAFVAAPHYGGRIAQLVEDALRMRQDGCRVVVVSRQAERLASWFAEAGEVVTPAPAVAEAPPRGSLNLVSGTAAEGLQLLPNRQAHASDGTDRAPLVLLTDTEIFGWAKVRRRPYTRKKAASPESFFADLHEGDYVVHIDHGIGIYRGLVQKESDGANHEYAEIEYADTDRLYVPVSQIDRVTRYVGASELQPKVHRLGAADWGLVRSRAQKAVEDIAQDLLKLYAAREVVRGHQFAPDTVWQEELEASFPYAETPDQLSAVAEVKRDMEMPRPMDRLLCGDVGYGKTEVAVRAAFKAVMDGKQVAVLVPTTVLAQQHLLTFQQRLAAFPVEIAMLSRFCSHREQKLVAQRLQEGTLDIVIGTHRLLQKDIVPKDLGLLVVDEEQRFGVRHKEWLKQMRQQVDVLTLTATPIPRTLYMALSGVRDMSTIDTPPEERLPIRTQAARFDEAHLRRVILREMDRNGQVYFVHNRVQGIRQIAQNLQKIVPEASIAIGHGQMPEEKLSQVMLDFAAGQYHVLVCTSIIESGLDIPNVNTIIINRADLFGLAQLYQLRGRVGRSTAQAHAYLLYDQRELSDIARRRLEAVLEASELGAGFRIAMRDLEIRGAGEVLGSQQHGHISAIGFELYTRLLAHAVEELKATGASGPAPQSELALPPLIELPIEAMLPEDYIADDGLRLKVYQRLASLTDEEQLDDASKELEDRFGILPEQAQNLMYVLRIRLLASKAGVLAIAREDRTLVLRLSPAAQARAKGIVAHFGRQAWVGRGQMWFSIQDEQADWRTLLLTLLLRLDDASGKHTPQ